MLKKVLIATLLAAPVAVLSACGDSSKPAAPAPTQQSAPAAPEAKAPAESAAPAAQPAEGAAKPAESAAPQAAAEKPEGEKKGN